MWCEHGDCQFKNNQMMEFLVRIKAGDEEARQQFVRGNLRLVLSIIQKFNNRGENIDDLFQIGCIGLIKAMIISFKSKCEGFELVGSNDNR